MGGLGCVSMMQIAILVAATVRGRLTMRVLEEAAEVGAPKQVAQKLSQRWRAATSGPMPTPPSLSLLPPSSPPPLPAFAARSGGPALRSSAAPASQTPAPLPGTNRSDPMSRAPAAELPSEASIEEPASKRPTNSSSSGGKGGQGGKGGRGKGGKGAAAKSAQTTAKGAKAKGGGYKDGERKGKRERAGERSKGEHGERGKRGKGGKGGKGGKEQAVAWSAPSPAQLDAILPALGPARRRAAAAPPRAASLPRGPEEEEGEKEGEKVAGKEA